MPGRVRLRTGQERVRTAPKAGPQPRRVGKAQKAKPNVSDDRPIELWYHGTVRRNATSILKAGFAPGTYFTHDLESAIVYGGSYVFKVAFQFDAPADPEQWQITFAHVIPTSQIVSLEVFPKPRTKYVNEPLLQLIGEKSLERQLAWEKRKLGKE